MIPVAAQLDCIAPKFGQVFRKLLLNIVIATDMGVHNQFMERFRQMVDGHVPDELERRILVCQALIKCADISNPVSTQMTPSQDCSCS